MLETAVLSQQEFSEYCRRNGLYPEQIARWRAACAQANDWEHASKAPAQIVADLADLGRYLASESTFYRVLKARG